MSIPVRNKDQTIRRPTKASFSGSLFMPLAFLVPATLVNFVSAHLELRNTLDRAKAEMDAAAKTAQAEARSKAKTTAKKEPPKLKTTTLTDTPRPAQPVKEEPSRTASLFDAPASRAAKEADSDEEEEILAETPDDGQSYEEEGFDEAA